ncbi:MAG: hypothetical protein HZC10_08795 [Nitrospirae bacterium]|nr:hypothetical protein [Nitrospirota bacterium]
MCNYFDFKTPIDIASAIIGGIIGLFLVLLFEWFTKPRILFWQHKFIAEDFNLGYKKKSGKLYKLKFKVWGFRSPGFCELHIYWCGNAVKAKWDDAPNPLIADNPAKFEPRLVPQTFLNTIMLKQYYTIPIINIDRGDGDNITIFDGWWFGKRLRLPYGPNPIVNKDTKIKLVLKGNDLSWSNELTVQQIIDNVE